MRFAIVRAWMFFAACSLSAPYVCAAQSPAMPLVFASRSRTSALTPLEEPILLVPRVHSGGPSDAVTLLFYNSSSDPFYFLEGYTPNWPAHMQLSLYREGVNVPPRVFLEPPMAVPERVRKLAPGEYLVFSFSVRDMYRFRKQRRSLPSGVYEVRATYDVRQGDMNAAIGCTPMQMNRTVLFIDIDGTMSAVSPSVWFLLLVPVAGGTYICLRRWRCRMSIQETKVTGAYIEEDGIFRECRHASNRKSREGGWCSWFSTVAWDG